MYNPNNNRVTSFSRNRRRNINRRTLNNFKRDVDGDNNIGLSGTPFLIEPTRTITMAYTDSILVRNNAGNKYLYFRLRANALYDPDPLLLTGGVSGFSEYGAFYRRYLVTQVCVDWQVTNLESFPITLVHNVTPVDLVTAVTSPNLVLDMAENVYSIEKKLSQAGGMDRVRIIKTVNLATCHGNPMEYMASENYSGLGGTAPANPTLLFYLNFAVASNTNLVNGIDSTLRIRFKVKWYERQNLEDRTLRIARQLKELPEESDSFAIVG